MGVRIAFGVIGSALWAAVAAFHVQEAWPALAEFKANELTDFRARQSAEVAFFWLVLGYIWLVTAYFQQRADLRQSMKVMQEVMKRAEERLAEARARLGADQTLTRLEGALLVSMSGDDQQQ